MIDLNAYVGRPWRQPEPPDDPGFTCWGLVREVYREARGVELPAWDTVPVLDTRAVAEAAARESKGWLGVPDGFERSLDVILLRLGGAPSHVGLVIGQGRMLHVAYGRTSCIERYRTPVWEHRVVGFFRLA